MCCSICVAKSVHLTPVLDCRDGSCEQFARLHPLPIPRGGPDYRQRELSTLEGASCGLQRLPGADGHIQAIGLQDCGPVQCDERRNPCSDKER